MQSWTGLLEKSDILDVEPPRFGMNVLIVKMNWFGSDGVP